MFTRPGRLVGLLLVVALVVAACSGTSQADDPCEKITVEDAFVRVPPGANTAVYATIVNGSDTEIALEGATSDFAGAYELHESIMKDDQMIMRPVEGQRIVIPPGGKVALAPGGMHVMAIGVSEELAEGDTVSMTLRFSGGCEKVVDAPVKAIGG